MSFVTSKVNISCPVNPKESAVYPSVNSSGKTPIPAKLLLWILSYEIAITALTPYKYGPLAAQSLDDPEPYSAPPITIVYKLVC